MPVYNGEKTIRNSIKSVLDQDYQNFELLIINDGSIDGTDTIVNSFSDNRIKYFAKSNGGVSSARNVGISEMKGDFFCFLDADDLMSLTGLSSRLSVMLTEDDIKFVDGVVEERDLVTNKLLRKYHPNFKGNPYKELLLLNDTCFCCPSWMIRNDFNQLPQFSESLTHGEDLNFFLDCTREGGKYSYTDDVIMNYMRSENSAMQNLEGLNKFYKQHLIQVEKECDLGRISVTEYRKLKKKIARIMKRSYLKQGKYIKAILFR